MADFGIHGLPGDSGANDPLESWHRVLERLPAQFSTVWVSDHMQFGDEPTFEAWTLLTYLAATYPRFRYGHLVLSQSYRNPALLAKMAATLQALTAGRYILGLGAGWHEEEYRAFGYEYPRPGVRVAQLAEAIEVIRAMWTTSPATFHGEHYSIDGAYCEPKPNPPIPILVGTNGPKALGVVARLADMWCWDGPWEGTYRKAYESLRANCESIGRPFEAISLTSELSIDFPDDPSTFEPTYAHGFYGDAVTFQNVGPRPVDAMSEIERMVDHGVSHFQLNFSTDRALERFIEEVAPRVRLEPRA